jgi:GNAT superfamily N-acetyltransferase
MPPVPPAIKAAIDAFASGFCAVKSRTHPYEFATVGGLLVLRDAPRKNPRDYRKEEWITCRKEAAKVDAVARAHTRGRFFVGQVVPERDDPDAVRADYKCLGYRLLATEPFFVHSLKRIPVARSPARIVQVRTQALAGQLGKATRTRPMTADELSPEAPFRQYAALVDNEMVGWVRSIDAGLSTWCSTLGVAKPWRRQGIARALMARMLRDDRKLGRRSSVLLSSHSGAQLYPQVGYEQIGVLYIFVPPRKPQQ